ncbi:MAG: EscU/YscU/HrcU family type III secretion system export apparatus switch protein [Bryobacteraceae bacterium]
MSDRSQRTEQPTPRRIEKARREGRFPTSREFVAAVQFLVFVLAAATVGKALMAGLVQGTRRLLAQAFHGELSVPRLAGLLNVAVSRELVPLAWLGALLVGATLVTQLALTRFGFSVRRLRPDPQRLNPLARLRDLPRQNGPLFFQAILLLPLFGLALYGVIRSNLEELAAMGLEAPGRGAARLGAILMALIWRAGLVFLVFGAWDLWRQRRRYMAELRMTRQEVRDEAKEIEGNPQVRARIRRLQREVLRRRMMQQVPKATAVVVNPTHYAVALRYRMEEMPAPVVVAKGKNYLALRIRQVAVENQVPVVENPPLAQALYQSCEVGHPIPVHLYRAVAEVLAYIYRLMNGRLPG